MWPVRKTNKPVLPKNLVILSEAKGMRFFPRNNMPLPIRGEFASLPTDLIFR